MMGFKSATLNYLAVLIIKSKRKPEIVKLKKKSTFCSSTIHLPVMIVKLRKRQNIQKFWKTIAHFNKILL